MFIDNIDIIMNLKLFNKATRKEKKKTPRSKKKKIIITIIFIAVSISTPFIIWGILQLALGTNMPMTVVASGSMEPNLYEGDLVFLQGKNPEYIKNGTEIDLAGDIIVFNTNGVWASPVEYPVIHRVVDKRNNSGTWEFLTKGDHNDYYDGYPFGYWVPEQKIIGVVCGVIPKIGWIKLWFERSGILMTVLSIGLLILIISIIWDVIKEKEEKKEGIDSKTEYDFNREELNNNTSEF